MRRRLGWVVLASAVAAWAASQRAAGAVASAPATSPAGALARVEALRARFPVLRAAESIAGLPTRTATVALPSRANERILVEDDATRLRVVATLRHATDAPATRAGAAAATLYAGATGSADVVAVPRPDGVEDFIAFDKRPTAERVEYDVEVSQFAGIRLVAGVLELLDPQGVPRLRVEPPAVFEADGSRAGATLTVEGCAVDVSPASPYGRTPTPPGASSCGVVVSWAGVSYPALVDPQWVTTGNMIGNAGAATLLPTGKVLFTSGTPQLYDPASGTFAATGAMITARTDSTATLLPTNKVLVAGGCTSTGAALAGAELYDPGTGTFASTGSMTTPRSLHTATLLGTGKVLIAGGMTSDSYFFPALPNATELASAELYDPPSGKFTATGSMSTQRAWHTATVLPSGSVLVTGGFYEQSGGLGVFPQNAEIYSPGSGTFAATGSMTESHVHATAIPLAVGALIAGGGYMGATQEGQYYTYTSGAEIFNASAGTFAKIGNMTVARGNAAYAALPSGDYLIVGGATSSTIDQPLSSTETFATQTKQFAAAASLPSSCGDALSQAVTATALPSGIILVTCDTKAYLYTLDQGRACTSASQCNSGFCVDGYCCDTTCTGQCQACDVPGKLGTCSAVASGPSHGARTPSCTCDNGQCSNHQCSDPHTSTSTDGGVEDCAPYVCGTAGVCLNSCASVSDCTAPYLCDPNGHCVLPPSGDGGGCSCDVSNGSASWGAALLAFAIASLLARSRRAR